MGERAQAQDVQPRSSWRVTEKGRVFRGGGQKHDVAGFQQRQEKVLLGLGKPVQLVENENLLALIRSRRAASPASGALTRT